LDGRVEIVPYEPGLKAIWDGFLSRAKNGHFLFFRDYMDYHADRFRDSSLIFMEGGRPAALFPANLAGDVLWSHQGLTFGGVVADRGITAGKTLKIFRLLRDRCAAGGIKSIVYKPIPYMYHLLPAQEDLYALFRVGARLVRRDLSAVISLSDRLPFSKGKRHGTSRARNAGVDVRTDDDLVVFMDLLERVLAERHGAKPTHSLDELRKLAGRFPDNIKLVSAHRDGAMLAGIILYEYGPVAHTQYMASGEEGLACGALDLLVDYVVNEYCPSRYRYVSFGISTERDGTLLNPGLSAQKEMFGARGVVHDWYRIDLSENRSCP
jgi:hypothetical protein